MSDCPVPVLSATDCEWPVRPHRFRPVHSQSGHATDIRTSVPDSLYYPEADVTRLKEYCIAKEPLDVLSPIFEALGISRIVIEDFEFPFTVGEENQKWKIKAVSDHDWNLFVAIK